MRALIVNAKSVIMRPLSHRAVNMKYLCSATISDGADNEMFRSLLEEAGIPSLIRNENLLAGETGFIAPEVWILNDEDYPSAKQIIDAWRNASNTINTPWVCSHCNESIEGQFTACWKCGRDRRTR